MEASDLCICGHEAQDHHRSWFRNGYELIEECEYYGYNETGGAMQNSDGQWIDHCMKFKLDRRANHAQESPSREASHRNQD